MTGVKQGLLVGLSNTGATLVNGLAVFQKLKKSYQLTQQFCSCIYTQEK